MTGALPIWPERCVGRPFGDGPGEVTCRGLVCRVHTDCLGQQLPADGELSATDLIAVARAMRAGSEIDSNWQAVAAPGAFDVTPVRRNLPAGLSPVELTRLMPELPDDLCARGAICIGGVAVQRELWPLLRPRADRAGPPFEVTFLVPPRGGSGGGRKSAFALLASVALTAASGFIAGGGLATRFGRTRFAAGSHPVRSRRRHWQAACPLSGAG